MRRFIRNVKYFGSTLIILSILLAASIVFYLITRMSEAIYTTGVFLITIWFILFVCATCD